MPDTDGYPTEEELETIENWNATTVQEYEKLFEYIQSIWHWSDYAIKHDISHYELHTGGWSGNEDIIRAMKQNYILWACSCELERRGGHYYFNLLLRGGAKDKYWELKRMGENDVK